MPPTPPAQFHEPIPPPFLYVRVQDLNLTPTITALCAGYEGGEWRAKALADHMMEWLPEFALNYTERKNCGHHNSVRLLREAAQRVYKTEKFQKRGEFGELLLHIAARSLPPSQRSAKSTTKTPTTTPSKDSTPSTSSQRPTLSNSGSAK